MPYKVWFVCMWMFLGLLALAVGSTSTLVFFGIIDWFGPAVALFNVLATLVLFLSLSIGQVND